MKETMTSSSETRIWVIRPGKRSSPQLCREREELFFHNGIAGLSDDHRIGDLRNGKRTKDEMREAVASGNAEMHAVTVASVVSKLTRLASDMQIGDWVLCPSRILKEYRIGIVESAYRFDAKATFQHVRDVRWVGGIAKHALSIDAQRELGAARLFFECKRNAEEVRSLMTQLIVRAKNK